MDNFFAKNLLFLRKLFNKNQSDIADVIGKRPSTIGNYEAGKQEPIISDLIRIALFFKLDLNHLVTHDLTHLGKSQIEDIQQHQEESNTYKAIVNKVRLELAQIQEILGDQ